MGRLENFIPVCKKLRIQDNGGESCVSVAGRLPISVPTHVIPFIKQISGHLSLREIFLFLDRKQKRTGIGESLKALTEMAEQDFLINGDDFIRIFHSSGAAQFKPTMAGSAQLTRSYFSPQRVLGLLKSSTLFAKDSASSAEKILRFSTVEKLALKQKVIKKGDNDRFFYLVLAGEVGVFRQGKLLAALSRKAVFGESAAIFNQKRNADVVALKPTWVLKINAEKLVDTRGGEIEQLVEGLKTRLLLNQTLASNPLFRSVPSDVLQLFISKCQLEKYPRERVIFEQGETKNEKFFFIIRGSVMVVKDGIPVVSLAAGNYFGEVAALFKEPRSAAIISETKTLLLGMSGRVLFETLCNHFRLAIEIENTAIRRMNSTKNVFSDEESGIFVNGTDEPGALNLANGEITEDQIIEMTNTNFKIPILDHTLTTIEPEQQACDSDDEPGLDFSATNDEEEAS